MKKWKETSHSRTSESYSADFGHFKIDVVFGHVNFPSQWVMHCNPFFHCKQLKAENEKDAKKEAVQLLQGILDKAQTAINEYQGISNVDF